MSSEGPPVSAWPEGPTHLSDVYADLLLPGDAVAPRVSLGMVTSVDGAVSIEGRSGQLGGAGDGAAFRALRSACDVVLVGAGTVRAEDYGPPSADPRRVERRRRLGLADRPVLAVVTRSGDLDPSARLFSDPSYRPLVLAPASAETGHLTGVADVATVGADEVDLPEAVATAADRGGPRILCEGGPHLNGSLLDAGLVDEVFVTVAPSLVGGRAQRLTAGAREQAVDLTLVSVLRVGDELLLRYRLAGDGAGADAAGH